MTHRLVLRDLSKRFNDNEVVRDLNLSLSSGEFFSLLGPSGCGKSTTLAMIAGFEMPTSGAVVVEGRDVTNVPPAKRRIGLVFQDYAIFSRLTVRENLAFGLEARRVASKERMQRVNEIASKLQLQDILSRPGKLLNMSEMQRVAVARALVTKPKLLLLDEPMSNLDAGLRLSLRSELKLIQKELVQTVLYVTHDQIEAMAMSDRIGIMRAGVIEQLGTPEDVYYRPATRFVAEFIGDPPINLIPCTIKKSGANAIAYTAMHTALRLGRTDAPEGTHTLGVRPQDLHLSRSGLDEAVETNVTFVENLGAEHVFHVQYGQGLVAVVGEPGLAQPGDSIWLTIDASRVHLIRNDTDQVASREAA